MEKAKFENGEFRCPRCGNLLMKARYGAEAQGLEAWCRRCKVAVLVEIKANESDKD